MTEENHIILPNAELFYYPDFFSKIEADRLFDHFETETDWQLYKIKLFGKVYDQPRLTAFFNNSDIDYSYSKLKLKSGRMTSELKAISKKISQEGNFEFNSVLLNYYRCGNDSNGWHADNEESLGLNPVIASVSLGAVRSFNIKHNTINSEKLKIQLEHGSLLIMAGEMQHHWKHQIAKTKKKIGERINLTFRTLKN